MKLTSLPKEWQQSYVPLIIERNLMPLHVGRGNRAKRRIEALQATAALRDFIRGQVARNKGLSGICLILNKTAA